VADHPHYVHGNGCAHAERDYPADGMV